ncbi:hypothetical protein SUDANB70_01228 [Streptomyces sp. enrichment culture]
MRPAAPLSASAAASATAAARTPGRRACRGDGRERWWPRAVASGTRGGGPARRVAEAARWGRPVGPPGPRAGGPRHAPGGTPGRAVRQRPAARSFDVALRAATCTGSQVGENGGA